MSRPEVDVRPSALSVSDGRAPLLLAGVALLGCGYLALNDPNNPQALMPECPTKMLTGLDCPFCGGLRMVRSLLTGHWTAAAHDNLLLLACLPVVLVLWVRWLVGSLRGAPPSFHLGKRAGLAIVGVAVVFTVVRNLPWWPLHPVSW